MLKRGDGWGTRQRKPQAGSKKQQRRYSLHHYLLVALWVWFLVLQWEISPFLNNCDAHGVAEAETKDVCFLTCIFGDSTTEVDLPANVEWFQEHWCPSARFDLVTNLPDIVAPGWTKHIRMAEESPSSSSSPNSTKNYSNIVQSREAKFLAWKVLPYTRNCRMVVYLDGYLTPRSHSYYIWSTLGKFQRLADQVQASEWGLAQVEQPYFNGLTMTEIFNQTILNMGKDTVEHANATLTWMKQQKDYQEIMPYYLNKYFGKYHAFKLFDRSIQKVLWVLTLSSSNTMNDSL
jgi:hypothetical protein